VVWLKMDEKLVVERKLNDLASRNNYPITDREWHSNMDDLKRLEHSVRPEIQPRSEFEKDIIEGDKELDLL
jgi:hypothetical protein